MLLKNKWLASLTYFICLMVVLLTNGAIPYLSIPTLGELLWTSGFAESFANAGWPSIKAINFGLPNTAPIVFGLPGALLQSAFIAFGNMHAADAYSMSIIIWLAISLWGSIRLCQFFGTNFISGCLLSLIYLTLPIVWNHAGYSMLSIGFALLPLYLYMSFKIIYQLLNTKIYSRDWWIKALEFIIISILSIFMDGYTFVMYFAACGLIGAVAFIRGDISRKKIIFQSLPVILFSALVSYILYTKYVGTSIFQSPPIDFFRGWGVDVIMLLIPSQGISWLWDSLGISASRSANQFFGDQSVWMTTFSLPLIIAGVVGYYLARKHRYALPLLLVAIMGLYFSLGPSLKVNSVRPVDDKGNIMVQGPMMPSEVALLPTGNAIFYEHVPGFKNMRSTYRWTGLMLAALFGLTVLFVLSVSSKKSGILIKALIITLIVASNLPNIPKKFESEMKLYKEIHQMDADLSSLNKYLVNGTKVLFAPPGNDFIVNYIAATGNYFTYNVGGDKNLEIAYKSWPQQIKRLSLSDQEKFFIQDLQAILLHHISDYVVLPYFDLRWDSYNWPPSKDKIAIRKEKFLQVINTFKQNSLFVVKEEELYAVISLSPYANSQQIQSTFLIYPGQTIHFNDGSSLLFLSKGWHNIESWGVWSSDTSELTFAIPKDFLIKNKNNCRLRLSFNTFNASALSPKKVQVELNGVEVANWTIATEKVENHVLILPYSLSNSQDNLITLTIKVPDATSPKTLGLSADSRILGIGLREIELLQESTYK